MAFPVTLINDHLCINGETFTGNVTVYTPTSGKRLVLTGWSIGTQGHTGGTCRTTIILGSTEHASMLFPAAAAAATAGTLNTWNVLGVSINGAINEALKINGGATSGTISGVFFLSEV
jgi:hypothetical protein